MLDVKQAVRSANDYLNGLYDPHEIANLALEEVELSEDERYWFVTLGFSRRVSLPTNPFQAFGTPKGTRVYKILKLRADTGQVISMKIRKL